MTALRTSRPARRKPGASGQIDYSHPLAPSYYFGLYEGGPGGGGFNFTIHSNFQTLYRGSTNQLATWTRGNFGGLALQSNAAQSLPLSTSSKYGGMSALGTVKCNNLLGGPFSVIAWVKPSANPGVILAKSNNAGHSGWLFGTPSAANSIAVGLTLSTSPMLVQGTTLQNPNWWNQCAFTYNGQGYTTPTNFRLFLNGAEVAYGSNTTGVGTSASDAASSLFFGTVTNNDTVPTGMAAFAWGGAMDHFAIFNGTILTPAAIFQLYEEPFAYFIDPRPSVTWSKPNTSSTATLTAAPGAFVETGQSATLDAAIVVSSGSFIETGKAATLDAAIVAGAGVFAETGQAAGLGIALIVSAGSFAETGQAATLDVAIVAGLGAFAETGQAAILNVAIVTAAGTFLETGLAAGFSGSGLFGSGTFLLTGSAATLTLTRSTTPPPASGGGGGGRGGHGWPDWYLKYFDQLEQTRDEQEKQKTKKKKRKRQTAEALAMALVMSD